MRIPEYAGESNPMTADARQRMAAQGYIPRDLFERVHANTVMACHDVIIQYAGGALLVKREEAPGRGMLWPIGGRIARGKNTEESLRDKVREECGLELSDIVFLDATRVLLESEPFGHGKGYDAIGLRYFAIGKGNIRLNNLHSDPVIIMPQDINDRTMRELGLHAYVRDFLTICLPYLQLTAGPAQAKI
jgi:hypothetical protein